MRLTSVRDVAGNASLIERDALGRVQSTTRPFDHGDAVPEIKRDIDRTPDVGPPRVRVGG